MFDAAWSFLDALPRTIFSRIRYKSGKQTPPTDGLWHKYDGTFPVRLVDGKFSEPYGQVWGRYNVLSNHWEYRQDPETLDEYQTRVW